jgi:hypothetical protein
MISNMDTATFIGKQEITILVDTIWTKDMEMERCIGQMEQIIKEIGI